MYGERVYMRNHYGDLQQVRVPACCWEDEEGVVVSQGWKVKALFIETKRSKFKMRLVVEPDGKERYYGMTLDGFHNLWTELRETHP